MITLLIGFLFIGIVVFPKEHINNEREKTQSSVPLKDFAKVAETKKITEKETEITSAITTNAVQQKQANNNPVEQYKIKAKSQALVELKQNEKKIISSIVQKQIVSPAKNKEDEELRERAYNSVKLAVGYINLYYSKNDYKNFLDWPAVAIFSAERNSSSINNKKALAWKEQEIKEGNDFNPSRATDYQRTIIGILSVGGNPRAFSERNLVEAVLKSQMSSGKFADTIEGKGERLVNSHIWGIISLYSAGEKIPNPEGAYNWLVSKQNSDGGFGIFTGAKSDLDMTSMALTAFSALGRKPSDKYVFKAMEFIKSRQTKTGGFEIFGQENPDTASTVVQGLVALGINPVSKEWVKVNDKNMIDFIMSFQLSDGGFSHIRGGEADMLATTRALTALADYYNSKSVYNLIRENRDSK